LHFSCSAVKKKDLSKERGGGEYPIQDGFGWTNRVYQKLSKE